MFTIPQTFEVQTAGTFDGSPHSKTVTLSNGNVLVVWSNLSPSQSGFVIEGQVFDPEGNKIGGEALFDFPLRNDTGEFDIVALPGRNVAVTTDQDVQLDKDAVHLAKFKVAKDGQVSRVTETPNDRADFGHKFFGATVTGHGEDGFITHVVSNSLGVNALREEVNFDGDEGLGTLNFNKDGQLDSAQLTNGNIALLIDDDAGKTDKGHLKLNLYREDGSAQRLDARIGNDSAANYEASVTALKNGNFVVAFTSNDGDEDIQYQVIDGNGNSVTGVKQTGIDSAGTDDAHNEPAVAALEDGGFFIFYDKDNGVPQIRGQRFDAGGNEVGPDFVVASENGAQLSATALADGKVALSYTLVGQDIIKTHFLATEPIVTNGTAGDDILTGTKASDVLNGLDGSDLLDGLDGDDTLNGGNGDDTLKGGKGADQLFGGANNDGLGGGAGHDLLDGGGGSDTLVGGAGNDVLLGGGGNDRLIADLGADTLTGGNGADVFVFNVERALFSGATGGGPQRHVVTDFEVSRNGEKIDLSAIDGIDNFTDLQANHLTGVIGQVSGTLITAADDQTSILLENINIGQLTAGDFIF